VTIVHKPLSALWRKIKLIKRWLPLDDTQWAKLNLLKTLVQRDLEARYKGSVLGKLWPLMHQLAQLLIYTYVFGIVLQVKLSLKGLPEDNSFVFGLWLFAGLLPWLAFSKGLQEATMSVITQPNLVKKVVFPLTLLPLVPILSSFIESTFGLMALITFVVLFTQKLHLTLLLLPLVWLPQFCLTAGLGFLTAGLTVFLRDIPQTLGVVLNLWFYATPLIYPSTMIPQPFQTWVFWLNPMAAVGELYRDVILNGTVSHWSEWAVATSVSVLILLGGYWCYRKLRPAFADVL
jgi:lipopolysaccharide transport system permease protein